MYTASPTARRQRRAAAVTTSQGSAAALIWLGAFRNTIANAPWFRVLIADLVGLTYPNPVGKRLVPVERLALMMDELPRHATSERDDIEVYGITPAWIGQALEGSARGSVFRQHYFNEILYRDILSRVPTLAAAYHRYVTEYDVNRALMVGQCSYASYRQRALPIALGDEPAEAFEDWVDARVQKHYEPMYGFKEAVMALCDDFERVFVMPLRDRIVRRVVRGDGTVGFEPNWADVWTLFPGLQLHPFFPVSPPPAWAPSPPQVAAANGEHAPYGGLPQVEEALGGGEEDLREARRRTSLRAAWADADVGEGGDGEGGGVEGGGGPVKYGRIQARIGGGGQRDCVCGAATAGQCGGCAAPMCAECHCTHTNSAVPLH